MVLQLFAFAALRYQLGAPLILVLIWYREVFYVVGLVFLALAFFSCLGGSAGLFFVGGLSF